MPWSTRMVLLLCTAVLAPAGERVRVSVWVPVPPGQIRQVWLGDEKVPLVKVEKPHWAATVVVLNTVGERSEVYDELAAWLELPGMRATSGLEIWARGGSKETLHAVRLADGWRAFPWRAGRGMGISEYPIEPFLEQISHRFAGRGPVRVFSLSHYFHIALNLMGDPEYGDRRFPSTTLDHLHPYLGDSGLTLFPVTDLGYLTSKQAIEDNNTSLFGTAHWLLKTVPGNALGSAWQRSESGATITVDVPRRKYTQLGNPPLLRVYGSSNGRPVFERPFVAGGDPVDPAAALQKLELRAMRVTLPWTMHFASLRPSAREANRMEVCMESPHWEALPDGETAVDIEVRPVVKEKTLMPRLNGLRATRVDGRLCAGPLPFMKNVDLIVTAPLEGWITSLRLAAVKP